MNDDQQGSLAWLLLVVIVVGVGGTHHHHQPAKPPARDVVAKVAAPIGGELSPATILRYARAEGFTPAKARVATAVALAESAGRVLAHNPVPPDDSYCLMQINMLGPLGPARRARFHLRRNSDLYDPAICMHAAYVISAGGRDWSPWTTYVSGAYRRHLSRVP